MVFASRCVYISVSMSNDQIFLASSEHRSNFASTFKYNGTIRYSLYQHVFCTRRCCQCVDTREEGGINRKLGGYVAHFPLGRGV